MKSEEEIFRKAVLFWPASAEAGFISGGCLKPKRTCMNCELPAEPDSHLCRGCKRTVDKGGTP